VRLGREVEWLCEEMVTDFVQILATIFRLSDVL